MGRRRQQIGSAEQISEIAVSALCAHVLLEGVCGRDARDTEEELGSTTWNVFMHNRTR